MSEHTGEGLSVGRSVWFHSRSKGWIKRAIIGETSRSWKIEAFWSERAPGNVINLPKNISRWGLEWAPRKSDIASRNHRSKLREWERVVISMARDIGQKVQQIRYLKTTEVERIEALIAVAAIVGIEIPPKPREEEESGQ